VIPFLVTQIGLTLFIYIQNEIPLDGIFIQFLLIGLILPVVVLSVYALLFVFFAFGMEQSQKIKWLLGYYIVPFIVVLVGVSNDQKRLIEHEAFRISAPLTGFFSLLAYLLFVIVQSKLRNKTFKQSDSELLESIKPE
jgi:hypothetical protein